MKKKTGDCAPMNENKQCQFCDWSESNTDTPALGRKLSLRLPNGELGVYCSICHRVKAKDGGKYCKSFIKKVMRYE